MDWDALGLLAALLFPKPPPSPSRGLLPIPTTTTSAGSFSPLARTASVT